MKNIINTRYTSALILSITIGTSWILADCILRLKIKEFLLKNLVYQLESDLYDFSENKVWFIDSLDTQELKKIMLDYHELSITKFPWMAGKVNYIAKLKNEYVSLNGTQSINHICLNIENHNEDNNYCMEDGSLFIMKKINEDVLLLLEISTEEYFKIKSKGASNIIKLNVWHEVKTSIILNIKQLVLIIILLFFILAITLELIVMLLEKKPEKNNKKYFLKAECLSRIFTFILPKNCLYKNITIRASYKDVLLINRISRYTEIISFLMNSTLAIFARDTKILISIDLYDSNIILQISSNSPSYDLSMLEGADNDIKIFKSIISKPSQFANKNTNVFSNYMDGFVSEIRVEVREDNLLNMNCYGF